MGITLDEFKAQIGKVNAARPNRFFCDTICPSIMTNDFDESVMCFYIQSCTIPDRTFGEVEIKYYGMTLKVPGNESLSDLTINVISDEPQSTRAYFETWADLVSNRFNNKKTNMQDLFLDSAIRVSQLDRKGNVVSKYNFFNIFPKVVGEIELNYETSDAIETFQVTFAYSHWNSEVVKPELSTAEMMDLGLGIL